MFGDGAGHHPEEQKRSGCDLRRRDLDHHGPRAIYQNFARGDLAPVPGIRRDRERFGADNLAPDAAGKAEAIAADALEARLVVVRRAEPGPRYGDDALGIRAGSHASQCDALPPVVSVGNVVHSTPPLCPPSFVA